MQTQKWLNIQVTQCFHLSPHCLLPVKHYWKQAFQIQFKPIVIWEDTFWHLLWILSVSAYWKWFKRKKKAWQCLMTEADRLSSTSSLWPFCFFSDLRALNKLHVVLSCCEGSRPGSGVWDLMPASSAHLVPVCEVGRLLHLVVLLLNFCTGDSHGSWGVMKNG